MKTVLLLSDSTCKYVNNIDCVDIHAIPGANIFTVHQYIKENKARMKLFSHILLHVGTNDIGNGLSFHLAVQYYSNLFNLIKDECDCKVIVSAILPRPIDFDNTKNIVIQLNNCLSSLAVKFGYLFVRSYKPFVQQPGSLPIRKYFARDGLHLSFLGVSILRNFFIGVVNHLHV